MTQGIADTTVFIAREHGRPLDVDALPEQLGVSIITIAELRAGVLAATDLAARDRRLATFTQALAMDPIPIDERVAEAWALLRLELRDADLRMPVKDSWIAATALALGVSVVTQDDDYVSLPGIDAIHV